MTQDRSFFPYRARLLGLLFLAGLVVFETLDTLRAQARTVRNWWD